MKVKTSLLLLALLISGCAHYTLAPPERRPIGDLYSVESRMAWSRADEGGIEVWTIDGPLLEALRFVSLKDGDTLIPSADKDAPVQISHDAERGGRILRGKLEVCDGPN